MLLRWLLNDLIQVNSCVGDERAFAAAFAGESSATDNAVNLTHTHTHTKLFRMRDAQHHPLAPYSLRRFGDVLRHINVHNVIGERPLGVLMRNFPASSRQARPAPVVRISHAHIMHTDLSVVCVCVCAHPHSLIVCTNSTFNHLGRSTKVLTNTHTYREIAHRPLTHRRIWSATWWWH